MPIAALNVSGHPADFSGAERRSVIATNVKQAAIEISQRLGWRGNALPVTADIKPTARPLQASRSAL